MIRSTHEDSTVPSRKSNDAYKVEDAASSHLAEIVAIGGCDDAPQLTMLSVSERFKRFPEGLKVIVDNNTGLVAGYLFAEIWDFKCTREAADFRCQNDLSTKHDIKGVELHISSIAIASEYRDLGLSDLLLSSAIVALRLKFPRLRSVVAVASPRCRTTKQFFSKRRFIVVDSLPGFGASATARKEIALVMRKFFGLSDPTCASKIDSNSLFKQDFALA